MFLPTCWSRRLPVFGLLLGGNAHALMQRFARAVIAPWEAQ